MITESDFTRAMSARRAAPIPQLLTLKEYDTIKRALSDCANSTSGELAYDACTLLEALRGRER